VTHRYPGVDEPTLDAVDLVVRPGEFLTVLGPAGAGKTTVLRLVAGLAEPGDGRILLDGVDLAGLPARLRPVASISGRYGLFPFLDVAANVGFGLRTAPGVVAPGRLGTARRVREALELVRMADYARRRPAQLSACHQLRVALARALVLRPRVLLLDEPLAAFDGGLRDELAADLRAVHRQVGITTVLATRHSRLVPGVGDRVVTLRSGRIVESDPATTDLADGDTASVGMTRPASSAPVGSGRHVTRLAATGPAVDGRDGDRPGPPDAPRPTDPDQTDAADQAESDPSGAPTGTLAVAAPTAPPTRAVPAA
jgi:spermidine/putrescine transport system ATP-binding protein